MLDLQRGAGNAAVSRLLADRRRLARMAVDGVKTDIKGLTTAQAEEYLTIWLKRADKPKLEITNDEVMQLVRSSLAGHDVVAAHAAARAQLDDLQSNATRALQSPGHAADAAAAQKLITDAIAAEAALPETKPAPIDLAMRLRSALEKTALAGYRSRTQVMTKAVTDVQRLLKRVGPEIGLPGTDLAMLGDFAELEDHKARAREDREPLDELLTKYVGEVSAIIPGASLVYRGSLARGVKSPSKYVESGDGPALAAFDDPNVLKADPGLRRAKKTAAVNYDIDANIEIPDAAFGATGLREGPLTASAGTPVGKQLLALQRKIDADIKRTLTATMPGFDTSKFELFINTATKSARQQEIGNPYPAFMLEDAGMEGLAAHLPTAYAAELANKVVEYFTQHMAHKGTKLVRPLSEWEPTSPGSMST